MFKKKNLYIGVLLFISSYLPLFVIIIIQNSGKVIQNIIKSDSKDLKELFFEVIGYSNLYIVVFLLLVTCIVLFSIKKMIKNLNIPNGEFVVKVDNIQNKNHEYVVGYLASLILPFITLDLTSMVGLVQFVFLGMLIGYIYIVNELYFINPVLNLIFKYHIYNAEMVYTLDGIDTRYEAILLSKKKKLNLVKNKISVYRGNADFFIEKDYKKE